MGIFDDPHGDFRAGSEHLGVAHPKRARGRYRSPSSAALRTTVRVLNDDGTSDLAREYFDWDAEGWRQ